MFKVSLVHEESMDFFLLLLLLYIIHILRIKGVCVKPVCQSVHRRRADIYIICIRETETAT